MVSQLNGIDDIGDVLWCTSQDQVATEALVASVPVVQGFDDDGRWLHHGDGGAHRLKFQNVVDQLKVRVCRAAGELAGEIG